MNQKSFDELLALISILFMFFIKALIFALPMWIIYQLTLYKLYSTLPNINYLQFILLMWGVDILRFNIATLINRK